MGKQQVPTQQKLQDFIYTYRIAIIVFILGIFLGLFLRPTSTIPQLSVKRANSSEFVYTNPLLSCGVSENKEFSEYQPLEKLIHSFIDKSPGSQNTTVSVYYRELNNGRWFSINENETYSPASLFKVPIMIAYLKAAETNPTILSKQIFYTGSNVLTNDAEYYKPEKTLEKNTSYSVDELIAAMIKYSDNSATDLLFKNMDPKSLSEIMTDIGVQIPPNTGNEGTVDFLTVKSYSYLFRLLYNSTYLSRSMSEKAMKLLSYSDFPEGITAGVPATVTVAQKFGERTVYNSDNTVSRRELHDCGIVYYPGHPYLLCVMTKGQSFDTLSSIIKNISSLVYKNIQTEYKK